MEPLLYLVHRIPFPPNKGDKIRSYNLLKYLSSRYEVFLGTFVDDQEDWKYLNDVKSLCKDVYIEKLNPKVAKIKSLAGFLSGRALTLPYYQSSEMRNWVDKTVFSNKIKRIMVFSSSMAQYVDEKKYEDATRIIDFVDVDSDKWFQYSTKKNWPESYIYRREARCLAEYEKLIAQSFNKSLFVSKEEADHFNKISNNKPSPKISYFYNGVDTDYFNPGQTYKNPFEKGVCPLVFTGAMDYWANIESVTWFAKNVMPKLSADSRIKFYIVGSNPDQNVKRLEEDDRIVVTGRVPDVRPYIYNAKISVAPLRIARGIQNKVLEAMAMQCCVVASPAANEGIAADSETHLLIAESVNEYVDCIEKALIDEKFARSLGENARRYVLENFSWVKNLSPLDAFLNGQEISN